MTARQGDAVLVGNHLSTWARAWSAFMALECASNAASIWLRPSPIIGYLPGDRPFWSSVFFGVGAVLLGLAAALHARRRFGMFCFGMTATIHAVYAVGALGYSITAHMSWVVFNTMAALALLNGLAAVKVAGPRH